MLDEREAGERDFVLVDVREPIEWDIVTIDGSEFIPKGEFLDGSALEKLPQDKQVVLFCKVGGRSAEALAVAKGAGLATPSTWAVASTPGSRRSNRTSRTTEVDRS